MASEVVAKETGRRDWHAIDATKCLDILKTGADGLSADEARKRLATYGQNRLPSVARQNPLLRFLTQFNNALIYFLMAAAIAAILLGHVVDGVVILLVVLVNAIVGFVQEGKAEQALDAIRDMIAPHAIVVRGGERRTIEARDIVPGDIVVLEAGDKVPADLRLVRARGLTADEAILTGESVPSEKTELSVAGDASLGDRHSMLYSGTIVPTGQATGVVVATGTATEIGGISSMIGGIETLTTPLLAQINQFGRLFTIFAIGMAAALFAFAILFRNYDWVDALMVVVALAVGVVPEGLPAVITITLAIGVRRMAARNAVVRRLPAVETLGATSVICSDKTGTLTKNEMTARRVISFAGVSEVSGSGYAPDGELKLLDAGQATGRDEVIRAALLCNDARLVDTNGIWSVLGDPMEGALVTLAAKAGIHPEATREEWTRLDEIPFDALHRFMATLNVDPAGERFILVKGAPERVFAMCDRQMSLGS